MVRSKRARRRLPSRRQVRTSNIIRRVYNAETGVEFTPPLDQPPWASAPWWPITVVMELTLSTTSITPGTLHEAVLTSLNLKDFVSSGKPPQFNMRVLTVRAWGLARQSITLDIYDNSESGCRKLKQLNDRGSPINYSRLAWRFGSASYAKLNTECADDTNLIFTIGQGGPAGSNKVAVYVQLLIQRQGVPNAQVISYRGDIVDRLSSDFTMI